MNKRVELLAPAGNKEKAYYALNYGADAIFIGAKMFSLRARASNFEIDDIEEIVKYAHSLNKKVYLVVNVIAHNFLAQEFFNFFKKISHIKIDGFITADPYFIKTIRDNFPTSEIHVSTQQSISNSKAALFFKKFNATRVVFAREMTLDEIKATTKKIDNKIEVEIFIHGAVCVAFSGRCMMSNNYSMRDSNVGGCAQSCRWLYKINNSNISNFFTMSAKDMTYIKYIDELLELGVSCFKIEGRMKSLNYISIVTKTYRRIIDDYYSKKHINKEQSFDKLLSVANRDFDDAFLINPNETKMLYHDEEKNPNQDYYFTIDKKISDNMYEITARNYFEKKYKIKLITPKNEYKILINKIINEDNKDIDVVNNPMNKYLIIINENISDWEYGIGKKDE